MQKTITFLERPLDLTVTIPGSKSITNRALLLAALAKGESRLSGMLLSDDTWAALKALQSLGVAIDLDEENLECKVTGCAGIFPKQSARVYCQDAGTTGRFLLAACASQAGEYLVEASEQLSRRPLNDLVQALVSLGADISGPNPGHFPLTVKGKKLAGGDIQISGKTSSQFVSALMLIAPYMQADLSLKVSELISKPYVTMTEKMMASFGVKISANVIAAGQCYQACDYVVEPDLSSASYFFAAAAVTGGQVTVKNIDRDNCLQGDVDFLTVLEKMGCSVEQLAGAIKVIGPKQLQGVTVDMGDISDTMMTLAAIAPFASGVIHITNIANTRVKECDRIHAMSSNLQRLGVKVEEGEDFMKIHPGPVNAGVIDSFHDHRIAMAFSLVGLKQEGIIIDGSECTRKTFPDFFELWPTK
jgi:3-phosphoshikimate 1-carboxyvinyltransferase